MSGKAASGELMAQLDRYNRLLWALSEHIQHYQAYSAVDFPGSDVASGLAEMVKKALKGVSDTNE